MKAYIPLNNLTNLIKSFNLIFLLLLFGCQSGQEKQDETDQEQTQKTDQDSTPKKDNNMITIVTELMEYNAPDSIPSGWTTFQYINNSEETHLMMLEKLPEGKTLEDSKNEILPVFTEGMNLINEGKEKEGFNAFNKLPEWYSEVIFCGGLGLISPFSVSETTLYLEPGYYVMECYLKMPQGIFHSSMGMLDAIVVTDSTNENEEPDPTFSITLSSEKGIVTDEKPNGGSNTFSVYFEDQATYEHLMGHDLHLVKIEEGSDISVLEKWMDWTDPEAFKSPIPEGFKFLGGIQDMPAGKTGYFKATLVSGQYAFIAEVPKASEKNMLHVFTIEQ